MPGPWTIMSLNALDAGMELVQTGVATLIAGDFSSVIGTAAKAINLIKGSEEGVQEETKDGGEAEPEKPKRMSGQTRLVYRNLKRHVQEIEMGQKSLFDEKGFNKDEGNVRAMRTYFRMAEQDLAVPEVDPKLKERVEPFYNA